LTVVHFLLSLSAVISIVQISIVSLLLWVILEKDWKKYLLLSVVPVAICLSYYGLTVGTQYKFCLDKGVWELINASIPKDRFLIFFIFLVYYCFAYFQPKAGLLKKLPINGMNEKERKESGAYLWLMILMISGSLLILLKFKLGSVGSVEEGFPVSNRYFISLAPVGIIATTLFSVYLVKGARGKLMKGLVFLFLAGLLFLRIYRTTQLI